MVDGRKSKQQKRKNVSTGDSSQDLSENTSTVDCTSNKPALKKTKNLLPASQGVVTIRDHFRPIEIAVGPLSGLLVILSAWGFQLVHTAKPAHLGIIEHHMDDSLLLVVQCYKTLVKVFLQEMPQPYCWTDTLGKLKCER